MAQLVNRLSTRTVETIAKPGLHADGGGLYLSTTGGGRRWVFVYRWKGKRREMGLGSAGDVSLARARQLAAEGRAAVADDRDPIAERNNRRATAEAIATTTPTFGQFSDEYITSIEDGWRNPVHRKQWWNSLRDHASALRDKPIDEISTDDVLAVLRPIWTAKPETANRVRGRIETILAAAMARGLRPREAVNPAKWAKHLQMLLPKKEKLSRGHHAAMPYADLPAFMAKLRERPAKAARALEFLILNASRSGEVLGASWSEVSGQNWVVPGDRMKAGVEHINTLSTDALTLLDEIRPTATGRFIFSGCSTDDRPLSNMSMAMLMRRMGEGDYTVHGFRSAFKDWALNETEFPDEISEEALAHTVGSKVRLAYRRSTATERRRRLMEDWATFLAGEAR